MGVGVPSAVASRSSSTASSERRPIWHAEMTCLGVGVGEGEGEGEGRARARARVRWHAEMTAP